MAASTEQTCDCGQPAAYRPLIGFRCVPLCRDCYASEFPERAATFHLARTNPNAAEFRDPMLSPPRTSTESQAYIDGWEV